MPAAARRSIVEKDVVSTYHCYSRCVRRARLCGEDPFTGRNFDHRKRWIEERLQLLAAVFAVEICDSSAMDNHMHQVIRIRPDVAKRWSDEEVARRWWRIHPKRKQDDGSPAEITEADLQGMLADPKRIQTLRERLADLSWFMKELKEWIARRANQEDGVTGHFWAERFKSPRLLDEGAVLLCSVYVDLNPIRAGQAQTPEQSKFTSAYHRIRARQQRRSEKRQSGKKSRRSRKGGKGFGERAKQYPDAWLCPINEQGEADNRTAPVNRASDQGFLPMTTDDYLRILDWTGRQVRRDKRGAIPGHLRPILERLAVRVDHWVDAVVHYERWFHRAVGHIAQMTNAAARAGRSWLHGAARCRLVFA